MGTDIKPIMQELAIIRKEIEDVKQTLPDKDMFLTAEESRLLAESFKNEYEKKLISSNKLRRELNL